MSEHYQFQVVDAELADSLLRRWTAGDEQGGYVELKARQFVGESIASQIPEDDFAVHETPNSVWMVVGLGVHSPVPPYPNPLEKGPLYFSEIDYDAVDLLRKWLESKRDDAVVADALRKFCERYLPH